MTYRLENVKRTIHFLEGVLDAALTEDDNANRLGPEALDKMEDELNALYKERDDIEAELAADESRGARAGAEARLAYHSNNDTLDMY